MPDSSDRGARGRAAIITPLYDAAIEVHDLDSSFDLGAFAAEQAEPVSTAASTHLRAAEPHTTQPAALNESRPGEVAAAKTTPRSEAGVPALALVAEAAPIPGAADRSSRAHVLARLEALAGTHELPTDEPAAIGARPGTRIEEPQPAAPPVGRSWAPLAAAAILLAALAMAIAGLRGGAQVERAARARVPQQPPEQIAGARTRVAAPEPIPTPVKAAPGAATIPTPVKAPPGAATTIHARPPAPLLAKSRGPRARGVLRAAAVIVAASPGVTASPTVSARERSVRTRPASIARAVSTRGVILPRTAARGAAAEELPRVPSGALAGWLQVDAPVELDLSIDGTLVGTTRQAPALVAEGLHEIVLSNARSGFRRAVRLTVNAGQTSTLAIAMPDGSLTVESEPQAEVFVDGTPIGATPLTRIPVSVGVRQVVVRSASLGERTYEVVVREGQHTALSVDLRPR